MEKTKIKRNKNRKITKNKKYNDMKILKRNNEFKKMPEKTVEEVLVIRNLINQGWNYCSKEIYKEQFKTEKKQNSDVTDETPKKVKKSDKKKSK